MIFLNHTDNPAGVTVEQDTSTPGEPVRIYVPSRRGHIYVTEEEADEVLVGLLRRKLETGIYEDYVKLRAAMDLRMADVMIARGHG